MEDEEIVVRALKVVDTYSQDNPQRARVVRKIWETTGEFRGDRMSRFKTDSIDNANDNIEQQTWECRKCNPKSPCKVTRGKVDPYGVNGPWVPLIVQNGTCLWNVVDRDECPPEALADWRKRE